MNRYIFLDSGPLGLLTQPRQTAEVSAVLVWLAQMLKKRRRVLVPAIVYYEVKRELLRADKTQGIARLDEFTSSGARYLPLTDRSLRLAAELWAKARQQGRPTGDSAGLDIDVIFAAQVMLFGAPSDEAVIATTNERHLGMFASARRWEEID